MIILLLKFLDKCFNKFIPIINKFNLKICNKFNRLYHRIVFKYLIKYFNESYNIVKNASISKINGTSKIIWVFWWQSSGNMPLIVQKCINSIYRHSNGHKVVLLTKYNIDKYLKIPYYIYHKLRLGNMTLASFSDLIRYNLLDKYGGLWIDSTIYCVSDLNNKYFSNMYTINTCDNAVNKYGQFVSSSMWTGFFIGGCKHNKLFQFMSHFYYIYWKNNKKIIDYFMPDYALLYAYKKNIGGFQNYINNSKSKNNSHIHTLVKCLNDKFDIVKYNQIVSDTDVFKLTYKMKFNNSRNTFYYKILNNEL